MKVFAAIATFALAASTASVSAATCSGADLAPLTGPFLEPAMACQIATGYKIVPPEALPTADEVKAICAKCQKLIEAAGKVTFPPCSFPITGGSIPLNELFSKIAGQCSAAPTTAPTTTTTAPTTTTAAPGATTAAPGATTAAPGATTAAPTTSKSSSGSKPEETTAPEATTEAPVVTEGSASASSGSEIETPDAVATPTSTPVPSKTTSAGVSATLGAAVAVACSIAALVL